MGNFSEARRSMLEDEAECPSCHVKNERGNHVIKIDIHNEAWCSNCKHEWSFEPKEKGPC